MNEASELKRLIFARLGITAPGNLECPREKSFMTPCVARDAELAATTDGKTCVGCGANIHDLLSEEIKKAGQPKPSGP